MKLSARLLFGILMPATLLAEPSTIPDSLLDTQKNPVTTIAQWEQSRRPAILEQFRSEVYGRVPAIPADAVKIVPVGGSDSAMNGQAIRRQFDIVYQTTRGNGKIRLLVFLPSAAKTPVPAFLFICNRGKNNIDPERKTHTEFWPAEEIIARGYATAAFFNGDVAPDKPEGLTQGVFAAFDQPGERPADAWGSIGAWAWGASRALDALLTIPQIDRNKIAVVGHSRGGKTALWCGAQDPRFALAVSNNSGCTGAALSRGKTGEDIAAINKTFPHWFCTNYKKYNKNEASLPVDQHMLLALMAPRLVYVASSQDDATADPTAEFRSCVLASPVSKLYGKPGVAAEVMPPLKQPLLNGNIGYHIRPGKHDLTLYDWNCFMDFTDRHWGKPGSQK